MKDNLREIYALLVQAVPHPTPKMILKTCVWAGESSPRGKFSKMLYDIQPPAAEKRDYGCFITFANFIRVS